MLPCSLSPTTEKFHVQVSHTDISALIYATAPVASIDGEREKKHESEKKKKDGERSKTEA